MRCAVCFIQYTGALQDVAKARTRPYGCAYCAEPPRNSLDRLDFLDKFASSITSALSFPLVKIPRAEHEYAGATNLDSGNNGDFFKQGLNVFQSEF